VAIGNALYVLGGYLNPPWNPTQESDNISAMVEEFIPQSGTVTGKFDLRNPMASHSAAAVNGKIILMGGRKLKPGGGTYSPGTEVEEYGIDQE
jgi:hypothetical protein